MNRPRNVFFTVLVLCLFSQCAKKEHNLPNSIELSEQNEIVTFKLRSLGYRSVKLASDLVGKWGVSEMEMNGSVWEYSTRNPHKKVQYKFLIGDSLWLTDPLNPRKIKLDPPYEGFNSQIELP